MPRTTKKVTQHTRHKKILDAAAGYRGARSRIYRVAKQANIKAQQYAYRDRRAKKRDMRRLWIARINAACRQRGATYSRFMANLGKSEIELDRKVLAWMAVTDPDAFNTVFDSVQANQPVS